MIQHILWLIVCIAVGTYGVWRARCFAVQRDWLDLPNERSFHSRPTPRIGGWGLLLPVLSCLPILAIVPGFRLSPISWIVIIPSLVVAVLSFLDDRFNLSRQIRFLVHVICAVVVLWLLKDAWIGRELPLIGTALPVWASGLLLVIWITGLTNAYNFMDGVDGIGAMQGIVALAGWGFVVLTGYHSLAPDNPHVLLLIAILGGCIGFLVFNWPPASIFMGDVGSTFLGFFLAVLPLSFAAFGMPFDSALEAAVLFTWPFIFDTGLTFLRRLVRREPVFDAHRGHIYQLFASTFRTRNSGHLWTSLLYASLSILGIGLYRMDTQLLFKLSTLLGVWLLIVAWTCLRLRYHNRNQHDSQLTISAVSNHADFDIFLSPPDVSDREYAYVSQALDSGYVAPVGPQVNAFEERLAQYLDLEDMHAVSSGTAAIHLGLRALGVGEGDCVLCPDMTFIASCNPIRYLGAEPVLVDVSPSTWAMDIQVMKEAIHTLKSEGRTIRAMVVVHALGIPAPMDDIVSIAREEDIKVLEDCAGAFGSRIGNDSVGKFGDAAAFSFNGNKILTTSGGGALYLQDKQLRTSARIWANQGKRSGVIGYEHDSLGYNYKLSNISAAIGLAQLDTIELKLKKKQSVFSAYQERLKDIPDITNMPQPDYGTCNYWLSNFGTTSSNTTLEIIDILRKNRIEALPLWKPMHAQCLNAGLKYFGTDVSARIHRRFLSLPSGTQLRTDQIECITDLIRKHLPVA